MAATTIKRRRFQAPITSFFTTPATHSDDPSPLLNDPLSSTPLPEAIQSSLLTVGMRIRKSVPEGYKTHKTLYSSSLHPRSGFFLDSAVPEYETAVSTNHGGNYAELAPFCGLHKVGGMAVQPMPPSCRSNTYQRGAEEIEEPDPWSVPSSQESVDSNAPVLPSNKRGFAFDLDEDEDGDEVGIGIDGTSSISQQQPPAPLSYTRLPILSSAAPSTNHSLQLQANNTTFYRPFAIPHSRLPSSSGSSSSSRRTMKTKVRALASRGQENIGPSTLSTLMMAETDVNPTSVGIATVDFEDADFLAAREEVDELMDG